jgi:(1->4)-alpha-D-glucan 1-alpha-D-glucosylmutase
MRFGVSVGEFHSANQQRLQHWPDSLLSTSTHDSKRAEDVRARIDVLSEIPALFRLNASQWRKLNRGKKRTIDGQLAPSRNDEYLLYQTLIGAWPFESSESADWKTFSERIEQYMLKAIRESKEFTSWANPNAAYEDATSRFVRAILDPGARNQFLRQFSAFHSLISRVGMLNSLSQTLLKLTSPGVPDIYQGNELWDFSLVDPDNRRPVDYSRRREMLKSLRKRADTLDGDGPQLRHELLEHIHMEDGSIKMFLTFKTLCLRKSYSELFRAGDYAPLTVQGAHADKVCAFARKHEEQVAVVIAPRLWASLLGENEYRPGIEIWQDTAIEFPQIPGLQYRNIFTREPLSIDSHGRVPLSEVLKDFPVALLMGEAQK